MSFFKQIFNQGDEEKRKAMIKSFQTSGGTVLSTDWNDVGKKDYEGKDRPSPPKGQEWRKREL
jgi:suppressor of G2 allele of SKP1